MGGMELKFTELSVGKADAQEAYGKTVGKVE